MQTITDKNSLLYWYPKIKDSVPTPRTSWVEADSLEALKWLDKGIPENFVKALKTEAGKLGYPLFMRTAHYSSKHSFKKTCFIECEDQIKGNLHRLIDNNFAYADLPIEAIILREYLNLYHYFNAFWGYIPIACEVRHFIKDGELQCWHFYWPWQSLKFFEKVDIQQVRKQFNDLVQTAIIEEDNHSYYALKVAKAVEGYWSVDFARTIDGKWVLIDMAQGSISYHVSDCPHLTPGEKEINRRIEGKHKPKRKNLLDLLGEI